MVKVRAANLRQESDEALQTRLGELKKELMELRVAKVIGTTISKLAKIKVVRKGIARCLTVANERRFAAARQLYKGKKHVPKDLRKKLTRAMRRRLTVRQLTKKTVRGQKKASNISTRRYALLSKPVNCKAQPAA